MQFNIRGVRVFDFGPQHIVWCNLVQFDVFLLHLGYLSGAAVVGFAYFMYCIFFILFAAHNVQNTEKVTS